MFGDDARAAIFGVRGHIPVEFSQLYWLSPQPWSSVSIIKIFGGALLTHSSAKAAHTGRSMKKTRSVRGVNRGSVSSEKYRKAPLRAHGSAAPRGCLDATPLGTGHMPAAVLQVLFVLFY